MNLAIRPSSQILQGGRLLQVKIRVLVANQPRLMRELVLETIAEQPDIEVVGTVQEQAEGADAVEKTRPDYLIIALERTQDHQAYCGFLLGVSVPPEAAACKEKLKTAENRKITRDPLRIPLCLRPQFVTA